MRVETVSDGELDELADTEQPQGVVAVVEPRRWALEDIAGGAGLAGAGAGRRCRIRATSAPCSAPRSGSAPRASSRSRERRSSPIRRWCAGAWARSSGCPAVAARRWRRISRGPRARGIETWVTAADGAADRAGRRARRLGTTVGLVLGNEGAGVSSALGVRRQPPGRYPARSRRRVAQRGGRRGHPAS